MRMRFRLFPVALFVLGLPLLASERSELRVGDWEDEIGYRQAVRVGNLVYISGSVGAAPMDAGIKGAYDGIAKSLKHFGLGFENVIKETVYTTDIEALKAHKEVRKAYYKGLFPAATWVQVSRLFQPDYVIEVEVVAVIPDSASSCAAPASPRPSSPQGPTTPPSTR